MTAPLGWLGIVRVGLAQTALGSILVLTTSTLNRVMVVELALPAMIPGLLVSCHHAVQLLRPQLGYGSDVGGRRTPWILGGIASLGLGAIVAALATAGMASRPAAGFAVGILGFLAIGLGVGSTGTSLLALLAVRVEAAKRAAAATIVWLMMIGGMALTGTIAGHLLDPYSHARLVGVVIGVAIVAFAVACLALYGVEGPAVRAQEADPSGLTLRGFLDALREVWQERQARRFTIFVFISMLAFSAQDLILEPFAGSAFGLTPGATTRLSGLQNAGVMSGMILVAMMASGFRGRRFGSLRAWLVGGCIGSAAALVAIALAPSIGASFPLRTAVYLLGVSTGAFTVGAIGSMMMLAGEGRESREGLRMGLWGASQAISFAVGGFLGTVAVDLLRWASGAALLAYSLVFATEAVLFVVSAALALRTVRPAARPSPHPAVTPG